MKNNTDSMENKEKKNIQEMKTDLNLLLECLKYHMDSPLSQKEALITIQKICQQNSNASFYFREIGGLMFVKNLAKSSQHSIVKEAALYTLGIVAEQNVYCQQTLCTSELFEDLTGFLSNSDSSTNLKRMSVYVILVLVSNNRTGQTLVRETGCISVLSQLFRTVLSGYELNLSDKNVLHNYQLWSSVCSTLSVCVNNPQNDENQLFCSSLFPDATNWLISDKKSEIIRPICSFLGLTLANNKYVQEYFVSVGGLDVLSQVLVQLESDSHKTLSSAKLAVVVTKTVDACIADNPTFGILLFKYCIVSKLLTLFRHESLDLGEKFSILLTLGHCTEKCEQNQYAFLESNGLSLVVHALAESQSEELNKAATFVFHNCKTIAGKLSLNLDDYFGENGTKLLNNNYTKEVNLENYWIKAKEILHRIEHLEREGNKGNVEIEKLESDALSMSRNTQNALKCLHENNIGGGPKTQDCTSFEVESKACITEDQTKTWLKSTNPVNICYRENRQNKTLYKTSSNCNESLHEETTFEKKNFDSPTSNQVFKQPPPIAKNRKQQLRTTDPFTLCSDIINNEVFSFLEIGNNSKRCSGCIAFGKSLNSRNFSKLLHSCPYQCDRHKVIVEAEDRYKNELRKSLICNKKILLTPLRRHKLSHLSTTSEGKNFLDTPRNAQEVLLVQCSGTTPSSAQGTAMQYQDSYQGHQNTSYGVPGEDYNYKIGKRRLRKNYTEEEVNYLFNGVKKMGNHWNSILWSFPFQRGRKAVDLAHKYHKLVKRSKSVIS